MASAKINWQRLWALDDRALTVGLTRIEIRHQHINPAAAGDFIRLYLDDLEEKLEE